VTAIILVGLTFVGALIFTGIVTGHPDLAPHVEVARMLISTDNLPGRIFLTLSMFVGVYLVYKFLIQPRDDARIEKEWDAIGTAYKAGNKDEAFRLWVGFRRGRNTEPERKRFEEIMRLNGYN
jgi:hypothetical protein